MFTRFLACSVGMGLFISLMLITDSYWSRFFAAKWSVRLWGVLAICLCLPLAPAIPAVDRFFQRYSWIVFLWFAIAVFVFVFHVLRQQHFRKNVLRWSTEPENDAFVMKMGRLTEELNLKKNLKILVSAYVSCPMILGLGDPILLLPHENYTDVEFDILLRHELYHFLHKHITYKTFLAVVNALHWFNPAVWMMCRKAEFDLESTCDDALLANASEKTRRQYSETILSVMQTPSGCNTAFSSHTYGNPVATGHRLIRLLSSPPKTGGAALLCLSVILSFVSSTAIATAATKLEAPMVSVDSPVEPAPSSSVPDFSRDEVSLPSQPEESSDPESQDMSEPEPTETNILVEPDELDELDSEDELSIKDMLPDKPEETEENLKFPTDAFEYAAENMPAVINSLNRYAESLVGNSDSLQEIMVAEVKTGSMPSNETFITIINKVIRAYNNDTADTSMSDPDAPRLMPVPSSVGTIPEITSPDDFTALPRTENGYSIAIPLENSGIQMQIWVDDNGTDDSYSFDIVAVNFARG